MSGQYNLLETPIEYLKGVGPSRAETLKKELEIFTFGDLLMHMPFRYVDRTKIYKVREVNPLSQYVQLKGILKDIDVAGDKHKKRMIANLVDETGTIELVWFAGVKWMKELLLEGKEYIVFGKPSVFGKKMNIVHPDITSTEDEKKSPAGILQPFYPSTEKLKAKSLDSRGISRLTRTLFQQVAASDLKEIIPKNILEKFRLPSRYNSFQQVHFPSNEYELERARQRLKFEELFFIQLKLLQVKIGRKESSVGFVFNKVGDFFNRFYKEKLPFALTDAQKKVIKEIRADLVSGKQMNRLLQGDVGSGKTVVALSVILLALDNGMQSCFMVPTEILAQQHFQSIKELVEGLGINISLLTSSTKTKERKNIHEGILSGEIHLLIGTHSLIEDTVQFKNLGLVIIDEQHRFGVEQRGKMWTKNNNPPHILVMTATPIPRTLAMTLYGDLDVSVIDELPPGRKPIKTVHYDDSARMRVFGFMREQIMKDRQVYVVYPLIDESEKLDYKYLMDGFESISREFPLPQFAVSIVHGKMKSEDRDFEMRRFIKRETQIMIATTVIEVGVNIPNASVMVIESAERFGLSQLHQLRGRVGRGADQSYCILMTERKLNPVARKRMQTMVETNDGFKIAEVDMELRGPGDMEGTQQSGILNLRIADLVHDKKILLAARTEAEIILEKDDHLQLPEHQSLATFLLHQQQRKGGWSKIS
ncbi:ATP-dependent DNA helicase RecG [Bacteroidota bacterium]|nr:ATP-dependent DNA helicase RecG [Bacteroidota bacterium]